MLQYNISKCEIRIFTLNSMGRGAVNPGHSPQGPSLCPVLSNMPTPQRHRGPVKGSPLVLGHIRVAPEVLLFQQTLK